VTAFTGLRLNTTRTYEIPHYYDDEDEDELTPTMQIMRDELNREDGFVLRPKPPCRGLPINEDHTHDFSLQMHLPLELFQEKNLDELLLSKLSDKEINQAIERFESVFDGNEELSFYKEIGDKKLALEQYVEAYNTRNSLLARLEYYYSYPIVLCNLPVELREILCKHEFEDGVSNTNIWVISDEEVSQIKTYLQDELSNQRSSPFVPIDIGSAARLECGMFLFDDSEERAVVASFQDTTPVVKPHARPRQLMPIDVGSKLLPKDFLEEFGMAGFVSIDNMDEYYKIRAYKKFSELFECNPDVTLNDTFRGFSDHMLSDNKALEMVLDDVLKMYVIAYEKRRVLYQKIERTKRNEIGNYPKLIFEGFRLKRKCSVVGFQDFLSFTDSQLKLIESKFFHTEPKSYMPDFLL
jgi:hypothetical protein